MENELEVFKRIFSDSDEDVFILNYNFDVLWHNSDEIFSPFCGADFSSIFKDEKKPVDSGRYFLSCQSLEFAAEMINYKKQELYILKISRKDIMSSLAESKCVREFFENQAAMIRQAVSGITTAKNILHSRLIVNENTLSEADIRDCSNYLNVISGNSCRLLKTLMTQTELIKYSDRSGRTVKIDLSGELEKFVSACGKLLKNQIKIAADISPKLFIKADPDRLTAFLLSAIAFAGSHSPESNVITLSAMKVSENVSITVSAKSTSKNENEHTGRLFSRFDNVCSSEASDPELIIINQFCQAFNGRLYDCTASENGEIKICVRLPFCDEPDKTPFLSSRSDDYDKNKFSVYRIALSGIADIY